MLCVSDVEEVLVSVQNAAMFTSLLPMISACVAPVAASDPHVCDDGSLLLLMQKKLYQFHQC